MNVIDKPMVNAHVALDAASKDALLLMHANSDHMRDYHRGYLMRHLTDAVRLLGFELVPKSPDATTPEAAE